MAFGMLVGALVWAGVTVWAREKADFGAPRYELLVLCSALGGIGGSFL